MGEARGGSALSERIAYSLSLAGKGKRSGKMQMKASPMSSVTIEIDEALAKLLHQTNQPLQAAGREMIGLELYRRGSISSGKAGELVGMPRIDFIKHASRLGIPYIDMTEDEWAAEKAASKSL